MYVYMLSTSVCQWPHSMWMPAASEIRAEGVRSLVRQSKYAYTVLKALERQEGAELLSSDTLIILAGQRRLCVPRKQLASTLPMVSHDYILQQ